MEEEKKYNMSEWISVKSVICVVFIEKKSDLIIDFFIIVAEKHFLMCKPSKILCIILINLPL